MFQLAIQLVNESSRNIFLTGKAGTGKTTFLRYIKENSLKQMAIVAPTGVAAINAGGVTIHSFFQLPLSPFVPEGVGGNEEVNNKHSLISRLRLTGEKRKVLQQLELLVIDEISMVRSDTLDAVDTVLKHIRRRPHESFGGVQVLFIGDMMQLPPVIREQEWMLLNGHYNSPYFFDSKCISNERPVYIEFDKIYRQSEEKFIELLNQVRNNDLDHTGLEILEERFQPGFERSRDDGYVVLTTHNEKARQINMAELNHLDGELRTFKAVISGEFSDRAYPGDETLELKVGAQVMFIRNDTSDRGKRYFNGKIGTVTKLEKDKIWVRCQGESEDIEVQKEKWENIRYSVDRSTMKLGEELLGSFSQFPLRLAWAITIHKSQGLTFEKAIIDAGAAFAPGQVYVALSRCTNLDGLVLQTRIRSSSLLCDEKIVEFSRRSASTQQLQEELVNARKQYQFTNLNLLFSCRNAIHGLEEILTLLRENKTSFNKESLIWAGELKTRLDKLQETSGKFEIQLRSMFFNESQTAQLSERLNAAARFFREEFNQLLLFIQRSPVTTDSRTHAKEFNEGVRELTGDLAMKKHLLEGDPDLLNPIHVLTRRKSFIMPLISVNAYAATKKTHEDVSHPELLKRLRELREEICRPSDMPIYLVAGTQTLHEITRYLPQTLSELRKISGFGDAKVKKYGQQFLDLVLEYTKENGLSSLIHEKPSKRERIVKDLKEKGGSGTKAESFKLFKSGKSIPEIAVERNLKLGTIESHLSEYVASGLIAVEELISSEKLSRIESALENPERTSLSQIKQNVGDDVSYGELRFVIAAKQSKNPAISR